jgi:hypothetical protein
VRRQAKNGRYEKNPRRQNRAANVKQAPVKQRRLHLAMQPEKRMEAQDMKILRFL